VWTEIRLGGKGIMPTCYKCGKKENAMKCVCDVCMDKPIEEIDKLIRQIEMEKHCLTRQEDIRYLDGQIEILLILRGKL
jgi:hypothetical protein